MGPTLPAARELARTGRAGSTVVYAEASGRKAAALGREDGTFEAWVYPLKVLHDFGLTFQTPAYADPIPATAIATTIEVRPESVTIRHAHAAFTVVETWVVGLDAPGGLVLLDVDTSVPLTIGVRFRPDLKPMWPTALGGHTSYWDADAHAYVIGEASRAHAALVGCPLAITPPEQPAHNLPDAPLRFEVPVTRRTPALAHPDRLGGGARCRRWAEEAAPGSRPRAAGSGSRLAAERGSLRLAPQRVRVDRVALRRHRRCPRMGQGRPRQGVHLQP